MAGGWTRDGSVRQTAFKGVEPGRDPTTVSRETAVATTSAVRAAEADAGPPAPGGPPEEAAALPRAPTQAPRTATTHRRPSASIT